MSEIFSTFGGANTSAWAQNPFNTTSAERSFSGLDIPHQWTILLTEELPFFKEQHGFVGHVLGGWSLNANYILASGQRYTPVQAVSAFLTDALISGTTPYDLGFINNFVGIDVARPFLGNMNAPQTSVGMYAGDACFLFSFTGTDPLCTGSPTQLIDLTSVGRSGCESDPTVPCPFNPVTNNQVRFIVNSATAQTVFGTPFGNMPRNLPQDAISNVANLSVMKRFKVSERNSFEMRFSALNVFNHPNFTSVDPFVEDAGLSSSFTGFGDPSLTGSVYPGFNNATRRVNFGATFRF